MEPELKYLLITKSGKRYIFETNFSYLTYALTEQWQQVNTVLGDKCWLVMHEVECWKEASEFDLAQYKENN